MYYSKSDLQRPLGSISGMLAFLVCWIKETLRGAKSFIYLMKKIAFIFFLAILSNQAVCQFEEGNILRRISLMNNSFIFTSINCQYPDSKIISEPIANYLLKYTTTDAISDKNGNLLFFTDGIHIYNRVNKTMEGGDFAVLQRYYIYYDEPFTHIIVPEPQNERFYNVFYINPLHRNPQADELLKGNSSLCRTIIDIKANNGLGKVIRRDTNIYFVNTLDYTEGVLGITAIKHYNNKDFWIVTSSANITKAFLLTNDSLNLNPVNSVIKSHPINVFYPYISPYGKYLIPETDTSLIRIYYFDTKTGKVDTSKIFFSFQYPINQFGHVVFLEYIQFSPDETKLYTIFVDYDTINNKSFNHICQYDLTSGDSATIAKSFKIIITQDRSKGGFASIYTAIDNKVYIQVIIKIQWVISVMLSKIQIALSLKLIL